MCTKFYVFLALAIVLLGFTTGLTKSLAKSKIIRRLNRKMPKLFYTDDNCEFNFTEAQNILKISQENEINHLHVCGGLGKCSTCRVQIIEGLGNCSERSLKEQNIADKLDFPDDVRLACQTILSGDAKIRKLFKSSEDVKFAQAAMQTSGSIGSHKQVAILFADIENFTPLSERLASFDVMYLLNKYFDFAGNIVMRNGGDINNYIGDAFLAIFGLDGEGDETFRAVNAELELQSELKNFANSVEENFDEEFKIRIGVHFGEAIVGMLGCKGTERLSVIGDTVNMAARAESANKEADTTMLITENAYKQIEERVEVEDFIRTKLKGTSERITLYEIKSVIGETLVAKKHDALVRDGIKWTRATASKDLSGKNKFEFDFDGEDILLFRFEDEIRAIQNSCTHMNLPLSSGVIDENGHILCPYHGSAYCTHDGTVQKWCEGLPEDMPPENVQMMKSMKQVPLPKFMALDCAESIWVAKN